MEGKSKTKKAVLKVRHVEVTREGRTERVLKGKELEEWKKAHGIDVKEDGEGTK